MVYYGLGFVALLVYSLGVQANYIGKRDPERDYYTLNIPGDDSTTAHHVARSLNVRLEGVVGELKDWYMVSSPKPLYQKRETEDRVLAAFQHYKTLGLSKRDGHWEKVQSIDKQVLRKRTKRGPIPEDVAKAQIKDAQQTLKIADPWFDQQWHLVNTYFLFAP